MSHLTLFWTCRFLTSWSGVTSTWRKGLRRRSRRWDSWFELLLGSWHWWNGIFYFHNKELKHLPCRLIVLSTPQLLLFLKGFTESERNKLAMLTGILLANGNISAAVIGSLFNENVVKEGECLPAHHYLYLDLSNESCLFSFFPNVWLRLPQMNMALFTGNSPFC